MTDTHCHLNLNIFQDDLNAVLSRAWEHGLERILIPGIDEESSRTAVELAKNEMRVFAAVGIHPSDASTWSSATLFALAELSKHPKVAAIGEIGLDYYRNRAPHDLQREIFRIQLALAADVAKPVSIHIRDSWEDVWAELSAWHDRLVQDGNPLASRPGVLHSFDGSLEEAQAAIARGFFLGISGPVTFTNARQRQALVADLPLSSLLVETDSPYLTPHPYRGRRNEPAYINFIIDKIAALHHLTFDYTAAVTDNNAARLFAWRP